MTIQKISMLPFEAGEGYFYWNKVVAAGLICLGMSALCSAAPLTEAERKRTHDPLSAVLWSPPPGDPELILTEAQWGSLDEPFVFSGDTLHTGGSFSSNREVWIGEQALFNTHGDTTLHLTGVIKNDRGSPEGLVKLGAGALVLSGLNTYTGNTLLLQGSLQVGGDSALGNPLKTLTANTGTQLVYAPGVTLRNGLQFQAVDLAAVVPAGSYTPVTPPAYADSVQLSVNSGEATHAGLLIGSVPLVKQGAGRLRLSADIMGYSGLATVNEGALAVDRQFSGSVQVNRGARLEGTGQVGPTTVLGGGTLAPGNSIGSLSIQGDLVLKDEARLEVEISALGKADFIQVSGKALLAGDVVALAQSGDWQASTRYTILRAEQGFATSDRFAGVNSNFAFLDPSLDYDGNQVYLTLTRNDTAFDEAAETPTEKHVADAIEADKPDDGAPSATPTLYDQIVVLDEPVARRAFGQLSGSWAASVQSSLLDDSRFIRQAVLRHAHSSAPRVVTSDSSVTAQSDEPRFWSDAFYSSANRAAWHGTPADERNIQGIALGLSQRLSRHWRAGGFLGVQHSRLWRSGSMAHAGIGSTHAGLSLAADWDNWRFTLGAAHTWHTIDSQRRVAFANLHENLQSRYRAGSSQVFGEFSWPLAIGLVEPFVRLALIQSRIQGYSEQGSAAALDVRPAQPSVLISTAGMKLTQLIETPQGATRVQGLLAWRHANGDVHPASRQSFRNSVSQREFESDGQPLARQGWLLELGMHAAVAKKTSLGFAYAGHYASGLQDHGVRVHLAWAF